MITKACDDSRLSRGKSILKTIFLKGGKRFGKQGLHRNLSPHSENPRNDESAIPRSITISDLTPSRHRETTTSSRSNEHFATSSDRHEQSMYETEDVGSTDTLQSISKKDPYRRYSSILDSSGTYDGVYGVPISIASFTNLDHQSSPVASVERSDSEVGMSNAMYQKFPVIEAPIASSELSELTSISSEAQISAISSDFNRHKMSNRLYDFSNVMKRNNVKTNVNDKAKDLKVYEHRKRLTQSLHVTSDEQADDLVTLATKMGQAKKISTSKSFTLNKQNKSFTDGNTRLELIVGDSKKIAIFNSKKLSLSIDNIRELFTKAFQLNESCLKTLKLEYYNNSLQTFLPLDSVEKLNDKSTLRLVPFSSEMNSRPKNSIPQDLKARYVNPYVQQMQPQTLPKQNDRYFVLAKSPPPPTKSCTEHHVLNDNEQRNKFFRPSNLSIKSEHYNCTCPIDHKNSEPSNLAQGQIIYAYPGQLVQIGNTIFQVPHNSNNLNPPPIKTTQYSPELPLTKEIKLLHNVSTELIDPKYINANGPVPHHQDNSTPSNSSLDSAYSTRSASSSENNHSNMVGSMTGNHLNLQKFLTCQSEINSIRSEIKSILTLQREAMNKIQSDAQSISKRVQNLSNGIRERNRHEDDAASKLSNLGNSLRTQIRLMKKSRSRTDEWLNDLEAVINNLREDALSKWCRVNMDEVEAFERQLSALRESLNDRKTNVPKLKELWDDVTKLESHERTSLTEFLLKEEDKLASEIQKCRQMNSTLFTIKRLGCVHKNKLSLNLPAMNTVKGEPSAMDKQSLFKQINSIQPNHRERLNTINKSNSLYRKRLKMLHVNPIKTDCDIEEVVSSIRQSIENLVIDQAYSEMKRDDGSEQIDQIDYEVSDEDDSEDYEIDNENTSLDTNDQFCLINENANQVQNANTKGPLNTILKNRDKYSGQLTNPRTGQQRDRIVFSRHVMIEDGREMTQINCPMSDMEEQSDSGHTCDGNDSGVSFTNGSLTVSSRNPWKPINGHHSGNKVVDIYPKSIMTNKSLAPTCTEASPSLGMADVMRQKKQIIL